MTTFAWKEFLTQWSQELLMYEDIRTDRRGLLPAGAVASGWLGFPGAVEGQIAQAEARLGIRLPPSYREFLAVSNGWSVLAPFIDHLWSTDEIDWLSVRRQDLIDGWLPLRDECPDEEYLAYTEDGVAECDCLRTEHMSTALEISDTAYGDTAICFLNPQIVTPDGEWEAWFHAHWLPGAIRYRSFWHLVQENCRGERASRADDEDARRLLKSP
jgi:hypothetical protein